MKIGFICNQNLARSQILSSIFSQILPREKFSSFGLIANEGSQLPIVVESIFDDWGLNQAGRFARNLNLHWDEVSGLDCILTLTTFIAGQIKDLGFKGEVVDLEEHAKTLGIEVKDPQLMPRRQCAYELAKYVKVTISAFQLRGFLKSLPDSKVYMPENEYQMGRAIELAITEGDSERTILIADLIAPQMTPINKYGREVIRFRLTPSSNIVEIPESSTSGKVFVPRIATMWPAKVYLSPSWFKFLEHISSDGLSIVTPPIKNSGGKLAESYLAALYGEKFQIIGQQ